MAISIPLLVGTAIAGLGLLLHIVSIATTEWINFKGSGHSGLFKICGSECKDIDDFPGLPTTELEATRAMVLIGLIAAIIGVALAVVIVVFILMGKGVKKVLVLAAAVLCIVGGIFNLIGAIIFGAEIFDSDNGDLGYSFALCIVDFFLLVAGAVLIFLGGNNVVGAS